MSGVPVAWIKNLKDPKVKKLFTEQIYASINVLDRLKTLIQEEMNIINNRELSEDTFDKPNWEYRQAYTNGEKARLKKIYDLINITKEIT